MLVKSLESCREITAGDGTVLRELLHPVHDSVECRFSLAHARLTVGTWSALHALKSMEVYYVLAGHGRMEIDGEQRDVRPGDAVHIPPHGRQRILSVGPEPLEFLCIVDPAWRAEDEIIF